jgi:hypothetical protein
MMHTALMASLVLSQSYARSRMTDLDTSTQCLWWKEGTTIPFSINSTGHPPTMGTELGAIRAAFASWQAAMTPCSSLAFQDQGLTATRRAEYNQSGAPSDRGAALSSTAGDENVMLFRLKGCSAVVPAGDRCLSDGSCGNIFDCWEFSRGAIAITTTTFDIRTGTQTPGTSTVIGRIVDSDVELNAAASSDGSQFFFTTVDSPPCPSGANAVTCVSTDVQNTMTHEIGHLLGLAHISDAASVMNPRASVGELTKRTLDPGSKRFLCDVYPRGKASTSCFVKSVKVVEAPVAKVGCASVAEGPLVLMALAGLRRRRRAAT